MGLFNFGGRLETFYIFPSLSSYDGFSRLHCMKMYVVRVTFCVRNFHLRQITLLLIIMWQQWAAKLIHIGLYLQTSESAPSHCL